MATQYQVIFFADVSGSTKLYETVGDVVAHQCIVESLTRMTNAITKNRGRVVETIGDEILATFDRPLDACNCAHSIQHDFKEQPTTTGHFMGIRIGFHYGPIEYDENNHPYGDSINTAARVVALAQRGQIVITEPSVKDIGSNEPYSFRPFHTTHVKGKAEPITTVELVWDQEEATSFFNVNKPAAPKEVQKRIVTLQVSGRTILLDGSVNSFTIGRGPTCDIQVTSDMASRLHAKIEHRWGDWILTDHSTNGTYVVTEAGSRSFDGANLHIHRREWMIQGKGNIGFGQPGSKDPASQMTFVAD